MEAYEVFSVHQHGMAPMALLELAEVSGDGRCATRAAASPGSTQERPRDRDGRRRSGDDLPLDPAPTPWNRIAVAANLACSAAGLRPPLQTGRRLELNAVCRPYELGWLVEAWAGREELLR